MNLQTFRFEIEQHNKDHPELKGCIYPNCPNKIKPAWDNDVLCHEHELIMLHWFYERGGCEYCPDNWSLESGKKMPKTKGMDRNMHEYRKRYCDWIASLSPIEYESILKNQIGDEE